MNDNADNMIRAVYNKWQSLQQKSTSAHPDEEALAGFIEGSLPYEEVETIKKHLLECDECSERLATQAKLAPLAEVSLPGDLLAQAKSLVKHDSSGLLEIVFKLKGEILELINTTGDVLVGQELVPAPALRSRKIKNFKDEVFIYRDFKYARVELKLENRQGKAFNLSVHVKEKVTQNNISDLRITLFKEDLELESYHTDSGRVVFENILLGKYSVEISSPEDKIAVVTMDIRG